VIFPADMRVSQESDWNTAESARVFSSVQLVVRVFGRTSVGVEDGRLLSGHALRSSSSLSRLTQLRQLVS